MPLHETDALILKTYKLGEADRIVVFLSRDPQEHHQVVLASGRPEGLAFNPINQISFHYRTLEDMRKAVARLAQAGCTDGTPINHGNAWSVYIRDIEGNPMELYVDSPWYTPQPCGEPFDLSKSDAEIYRDTEAMCRARPGFEPAEIWRAKLKQKIESAMAAR